MNLPSTSAPSGGKARARLTPQQHTFARLTASLALFVVLMAGGAWMLQALAQHRAEGPPSEEASPANATRPPSPAANETLAQAGGGDPQTEIAPLRPPIGVAVEAQQTAIELAWVPDPESSVRPEAYDVLYWPESSAGFALRKRLYERPRPGGSARIEGLEPGTAYYVAVRAASQQVLEQLERRGDFSLSRLSRPVRVETRPNPELVLLAATRGQDPRAVFRFDYTDPDTGEVHRFAQVVRLGEEVQRQVVLHGRDRSFAPGYELVETRRLPYRPLSEQPGDEGWHELLLPSGEGPRDELDETPFHLRLPQRIQPSAPGSLTREAAVLRCLSTGEQRLLFAVQPW